MFLLTPYDDRFLISDCIWLTASDFLAGDRCEVDVEGSAAEGRPFEACCHDQAEEDEGRQENYKEDHLKVLCCTGRAPPPGRGRVDLQNQSHPFASGRRPRPEGLLHGKRSLACHPYSSLFSTTDSLVPC